MSGGHGSEVGAGALRGRAPGSAGSDVPPSCLSLGLTSPWQAQAAGVTVSTEGSRTAALPQGPFSSSEVGVPWARVVSLVFALVRDHTEA